MVQHVGIQFPNNSQNSHNSETVKYTVHSVLIVNIGIFRYSQKHYYINLLSCNEGFAILVHYVGSSLGF